MKKALIYCRVSTEEQAEEGRFSLTTQERICKKAAEDLGYTVAEIFKDPGKTGRNLKRPGLQDLLIRCQEDKSIEAVFVQDTDRLSRNTNDHLTVKALLQKYQVKLISASQPTIDETPEGTMIDTIIAAVNQFQSDITARKTKKALEQKVKEGWFSGVAPIGYKNVDNPNLGKGEISKRIIVPDPEVAPLIKELFKVYATGNYSLFKVIEIMYEKGLRSRRGKKLAISKTYETLKNPFYVGEIHWGDIVIKNAKHTPLIDRATFNRVQEVIDDHNHHVSRTHKYQFLLNGFVYCAKCGARYSAENHFKKNGLHFAYYFCPKKEGCKHNNYIPVNNLQEQVEEKFKELQFSPEFADQMVAKARSKFEAQESKISTRKSTLYNQKKAIEQKRNTAEEKLLTGVIADDDFTRLRNGFREELESIQSQLEELEEKREIKVDELQEILRFARNTYQAYKKAPFALKRHYLCFFWERFEIKGKKIANSEPTRLFKALIEADKVRKGGVLGGRPDLNRRSLLPQSNALSH